jgi:hypothetical protein
MAKLILYLIPTALMIYGWVYLYRKNKPSAIFLISLVLLTTIGMVFYMNFADGNRPERWEYMNWKRMGGEMWGPMPKVHREVRVRDYFFTAGFMYFGMWIGVAASCLMHALFNSKEKIARTVTAPVCAVALIVSPIIPAVNNYNHSTRAGDWVAYDYAYNLLNNCEPNGIIFTNGDNDTFPLWALQEAYGIRNDVRVVNLSLVNTDWYIKQLKKLEPRVPISFSEEEISKLEPEMNPFQEPRPHRLRNTRLDLVLPGIQQRRVLRVQDKMVLNIVDANNWEKPIYFATTVSEDNLMGLAPYLQTVGMAQKVMPQVIDRSTQYDLDGTLALVDTVFKFRGIGKAVANETSRRLLTNYLQMAFELRYTMGIQKREVDMLRLAALEAEREKLEASTVTEKAPADSSSEQLAAIQKAIADNARRAYEQASQKYQNQMEIALRFFDQCVVIMPWDWRPRIMVRHEFYMDNGMINEAIEAMKRAIEEDPNPENVERYKAHLEKAEAELTKMETEG